MTTPSNFIEIPKDLFARMIAALEDPKCTPKSLTHQELVELLEDADQWLPPATDEEIERSFDANR